MTSLMKTRVASDKVGVHPTTIQRWVKFFNLDCQKNDHGHYLFSQKDIVFFQKIKSQLNNGLSLNEITIPNEQEIEINYKITNNKVTQRLELLETALSQKADDVVSFQVLQQRNELEELTNTLHTFEERIMELEEKLASKKVHLEYQPPLESLSRPSKQTWLKRMFSF